MYAGLGDLFLQLSASEPLLVQGDSGLGDFGLRSLAQAQPLLQELHNALLQSQTPLRDGMGTFGR